MAGTLLLWLGVATMLGAPASLRPWLALPALGLMWAYCVLDHVDGLHARLRRTSSPLGEYLDHALDAWNVAGVIVILAFVSGPAATPFTLSLLLGAGGIAAAATWLDQRETGEIHLGRVGPVEGVLVAGLYLASWTVPAVRAWWSMPIGGHFTHADVALLLAAAGSLGCGLAYAGRMTRLRGRLVLLSAQIAAILAVGIVQWVPWPVIGFAIVAGTATYSGRVITSHLAQTAEPWPDCIALPALVLVGLAVRFGVAVGPAVWLPLVWLGGAAIIAFVRTWRQFGHYWRTGWVTPAAVGATEVPAPQSGSAGGNWRHLQ